MSTKTDVWTQQILTPIIKFHDKIQIDSDSNLKSFKRFCEEKEAITFSVCGLI